MEDLKGKSFEELNKLVNESAEGLSVKHGCKVFPLLLNTGGFDSKDGEWVIGYYKEPTLYQCMTIIDNLDSGTKTLKGWQICEANLIKENSDMKYFKKEVATNKAIIIGAGLDAASKAVNFSVNQSTSIKKNGE